jgi:hypothetical protein
LGEGSPGAGGGARGEPGLTRRRLGVAVSVNVGRMASTELGLRPP